MIPITDIRAWGYVAPWKNDEQIEQDLVISRSLVEIFSNENLSEKLAFRGGTALHKLFLSPQPRYSEDIDLVQKEAGPISAIITELRNVLAFLGKPKVKQKANNNTLIFRFDSENTSPVSLRLKIEVNCREHFSVLGYQESTFTIDTRWFNGTAEIQTYKLESFEQKNKYLSPINILQRGYSITSFNGKILKSVNEIKTGDLVETKMIDGNFKAKVEK